jgi:hypothetical protein
MLSIISPKDLLVIDLSAKDRRVKAPLEQAGLVNGGNIG